MSETIHCCAECGASLPSGWPKGLCLHCALDGMLDSPDAGPGTHSGDESRDDESGAK